MDEGRPDETHATDRTDLRDLSPPAAVHDAVADLDLGGGVERVSLRAARGRVLGERVTADLDVPGFDRSALDGYAVRAADTTGADERPVTLSVVGRVEAGERPGVELGTGEAAGIATGAVMPPGADAMVPVEEVTTAEDGVVVGTAVGVGENVAPAGADVAAGDRALGPGVRITEREVGLLAAVGVDRVPVRRRPRVGIVPTGEELVAPGDSLEHEAGQIHDVNSYTVAAAVESAGGEPDVRERVGDDPAAVERAVLAAAADCDLVVTSGSTSVGEADLIRQVVVDNGDLLLHGAAVKPGKPVLVGRVRSDAGQTGAGSGHAGGDGDHAAGVVGLPGYPVSALTTLRTFVAPALRRATGLPEPTTATVEGEMAVTERFDGPRRRLVAVTVVEGERRRLVAPVDKGSGAVTSLTNADGVVEMPAERDRLPAGERVTVELFSPDVRVPDALGVGEADPALWAALDDCSGRGVSVRYLAVGSRAARERLRQGVPDVAVVAGPVEDEEGDPAPLATWRREWGLVLPAGNPEGVAGVDDLFESDLRLANRDTESGLRTSLAARVAEAADRRGVDRHEAVASIRGFDSGTRGLESPARRVRSGRADVGVGLRATAERLEMGFVSLGDQQVRVLARPERAEKPGVESLAAALTDGLEATLARLPGYRRGEE
jgi:putative molybdopterin biosynthesis protein